jgi:hypothetical protein
MVGTDTLGCVKRASPDFAVIAQKEPLPEHRLLDLDEAFGKDFGIDLETLAMRYEAGVSERLADISAKIDRSAEHEARRGPPGPNC